MGDQISTGTQAYRWLVGIGTACTIGLATLILNTVQKTADDVTVLKIDVSTVKAMQLHQSTRIEAVERRNDIQDQKIDTLSQQFWRFSPLLKEKGTP